MVTSHVIRKRLGRRVLLAADATGLAGARVSADMLDKV